MSGKNWREWVLIGTLAALDVIRPSRGSAVVQAPCDSRAAMRFAAKIVRNCGHVSEDDLRAVKLAGHDDARVIEIVLHVARNSWTNDINEVAKTAIDFPVVAVRKAA
jgi:alkylhydroperoxidase family enzyme